jgi:ATP synthase protein I
MASVLGCDYVVAWLLANLLTTDIVYKYMSTSPNKGDDNNVPPDSSTVILLMLTIADTTWRLFIPSVGLTIAGLLADKHFGTTPWIMILGIVLGVTIALLLVRSQMKKVDKK